MFCPKCSQQQVSDETRFCSRCGFQLNVVKALLTENQTQNAEIVKPDRSLRKRDMTVGAFLMFVLAFIGGALTVDMPPSHSGRLIIVVLFWMGLTLLINIKPIIGYFLRAEPAPAGDDLSVSKTVSKIISRKKNALPEAHSIPAADFVGSAPNTAEVAMPPSVTERTTNLLDRN